MSTIDVAPVLRRLNRSRLIDTREFEDSSPFGLQGLSRDELVILKPDCVNRLAIYLALRATPEQIQDDGYVTRVLKSHPDWTDEYQIVHLIERSLWIQGHSDLVMTMIRNPSQIPDNPPPRITEALMRAYTHHPDATIWYGVPLFGSEVNEEGLPIPVTADEVRAEAVRRLAAARSHALKWRWAYQAALTTARIPTAVCQLGLRVRQRVENMCQGVADYWKRCRQDARRRARAMIKAEVERCRFGYSQIEIPAHRTLLGKSLETACVIIELMAYQASVAGTIVNAATPIMGVIGAPLDIDQFVPLLLVPLTVVSCDPFLFVELPDEPGKLRHIGHWYWQKQSQGEDRLHLHV